MTTPAKDGPPLVSVVVSTRNRAQRLGRLLAALRSQELPAERFEVVVVDNVSSDETPEMLAAEKGGLRLSVLRRTSPAGPAAGRDAGWRAARGSIIAFTDDDCEPAPGWLQAGIDVLEGRARCFAQGRTLPNPAEIDLLGPFHRTIEIDGDDPHFHTCNIFYPRGLLEEIGGFDTAAFHRTPGGEDADLGWRAIRAGANHVFARDAVVFHAVNDLGAIGKLRVASRWSEGMKAYADYPELRDHVFTLHFFWKREHLWLTMALAGAALPRRAWPARIALTIPYVRSLRARGLGPTPSRVALSGFWLLHDMVEMAAVLRGAIRYRTPMI